jgi:hypothetical protein
MWSYKLFRIGALILALNGIAHYLDRSANIAAKPVNGTEYQLRDLLYGFKFNAMGSMRTHGDIYDGLSLSFTIFMLTLAAIGFLTPVNRKTAYVICGSLVAMIAVSLTYWFIMPTAFMSVALLCYAGCAYLERK